MGKVKHSNPKPEPKFQDVMKRYFEKEISDSVTAFMESSNIHKGWAMIGRLAQIKNDLELHEKLSQTYFTCNATIRLTFHKED